MLDRQLQRSMLEALKAHYPNSLVLEELGDGADDQKLFNIAYLAEHGLCACRITRNMDGVASAGPVTITAEGIDFLADDGGLSAILGVVTISFEAETLRALLAARINQTDLTDAEKSSLKRRLATLSEEALKAAASELVQRGLRSLPGAVQWLRTLPGLG